jgi:hypothetical protein
MPQTKNTFWAKYELYMNQSKMATSTSVLGKRNLTTTVELPVDLWGVVCSFLPFAGIYNLGLTCKSLREVFLSRGMKELKKQFLYRVEKYFKELEIPYVTPEQLLEFVYFFEKSWFTGGFLWSVLLGETWSGGDIDVIGECYQESLETRTYGREIEEEILQVKNIAMLNVARNAEELILDSYIVNNVYFEGHEGTFIVRSAQIVKCLQWKCLGETQEGLSQRKIADFIACLPGGLEANIQSFDMEGCMSTYNLKELHVVAPGNTLLGKTSLKKTYEELSVQHHTHQRMESMPYHRVLKYKKRGITFVNPLPRDPLTGRLPRCLQEEEE